MPWYKVAEAGTLNGLQLAVPDKYREIPMGKRTRIVLDTSPFPIAPLFDLAGAEFAAQLLAKGGRLIDVSGSGYFKIVFEIESVGSMAQEGGPEEAEMAALPAVVMWIGVIAGLVVLAPLVMRLATLFANFVPSSDDGSGGGLFDYFRALFGDYTPYVLIGGAVVLYFLLKPGKGGSAPIIYNITGKRKEG